MPVDSELSGKNIIFCFNFKINIIAQKFFVLGMDLEDLLMVSC